MPSLALAYLALADCVARSPITHFTLALLLTGPVCALVALEMIAASQTAFEVSVSAVLSTLVFIAVFGLTHVLVKLVGASLNTFAFD